MLRRLSVSIALLTLTAGAVLVGAGPASAHTQVTGTSPGEGRTIDETPTEVVIQLSQAALKVGTEVSVKDPSGKEVSVGGVRLVDATVRQDVGTTLPAGKYTVTYRLTSEDGHPVSGRFTFTLSSKAASTPSAGASGGPSGAASAPVPSVTGKIPVEPVAEVNRATESRTIKVGSGVIIAAAVFVLIAAVASRRRAKYRRQQ